MGERISPVAKDLAISQVLIEFNKVPGQVKIPDELYDLMYALRNLNVVYYQPETELPGRAEVVQMPNII